MPESAAVVSLAVSAVGGAVAIAAFIRSGRRIDLRQARELENRLVTLETTVNVLPTRQAVHELAISIEHLAGEVKELRSDHRGLRELNERQERIIERQEEFLLNVRGNG